MPSVEFVEKTVWDIEGFQIAIMQNGSNIRGDKKILKQYVAERMSKNNFTVGEWKAKFQAQFPGFDVNVYLADGRIARGNMLLSTVRDTYLN